MTSDNSYDFAAKPSEAVPAPEGKQAPATVAPASAAPGTICPSCGFRMGGKPRRGRCPECGAPLDVSTKDLLQYAQAAYARGLSWGPLVMAAGPVLHGVGVALVWRGAPLLGQFVHVMGAGAIAAGAWIVTAEEPPAVTGAVAMPQRRGAMGLIGRWAAIAVAALWVLMLIVFLAHRTGSLHPLTALVLIVTAVEAVCLGAYLSALAARVPHDGLAVQFLNLAGVLPVTMGVLVVAQFMDLSAWVTNLFFCSFPLMGGLAGIACWATVTLLRMAIELRNAAAAGEAIAVRRSGKVKAG